MEHDLRRSFSSLALGDGARKDILRWMMHGLSGDIMDAYMTYTWELYCAEVFKLQIGLLEGRLVALPRTVCAGGIDGELATAEKTLPVADRYGGSARESNPLSPDLATTGNTRRSLISSRLPAAYAYRLAPSVAGWCRTNPRAHGPYVAPSYCSYCSLILTHHRLASILKVMERERLSWQEMKQRYPDQWLVIVDFETDDSDRLVSGVVERHSTDTHEIAKPLALGKPTAFRYTGESTFRGLRSRAYRHAL